VSNVQAIVAAVLFSIPLMSDLLPRVQDFLSPLSGVAIIATPLWSVSTYTYTRQATVAAVLRVPVHGRV
jgi:hypothetical protein